jgi:sensor histidine kinase YesM
MQRFFGALLAWSLVGLMQSLARYADMKNHNPDTLFSLTNSLLYMLSYSIWIIITVVLVLAIKKLRYPFSVLLLLPIFIVGMVVWLPSYFVLEFSVLALISGGSLNGLGDYLVNLRSSLVFFYALVYTLTFVGCLGVNYADKTKYSEQQNIALQQRQIQNELLLSQKSVQLMQSQLGPHFLFNCLGAISGLARQDNKDKVVEATARVGDLLRFIISNSSVNVIMLDEELEFVEDYIALQQLRFEKNTLVSNSNPFQGNGTGLKNLRTRLGHVYNDKYQLQTRALDTEFSVLLTIPINESKNV